MKKIIVFSLIFVITFSACRGNVEEQSSIVYDSSGREDIDTKDKLDGESSSNTISVTDDSDDLPTGAVVPIDELIKSNADADTGLESELESEENSMIETTTVEEDTDFVDDEGEIRKLTWEEFQGLSSEGQDAYLNSFKDYQAFFDWMIDAQANAAEKTEEYIEIGDDGKIDLGN